MDIRQDAHRLLDELDEDQVATAAELLHDLVRQPHPLNDEPWHHEDDRQRTAAIEGGLALLLSGDLQHPDRVVT